MKGVRTWNEHFLLQKWYFTLATENEQLKSSARPNFIRKFNKSITLTDWAVPAYSLHIKTTFNSAGKIFQPFFVCLYVVGMVVVLRKCLLAKTCLHEQEIILLPEKQTHAFFGEFFFNLEAFWKRELLCTDSHLKEQLTEGQDLGLKPIYWKYPPKFHKG